MIGHGQQHFDDAQIGFGNSCAGEVEQYSTDAALSIKHFCSALLPFLVAVVKAL